MGRKDSNHNTQRSRILAVLLRARGAWVPLTEILALGCAQYNARLYEIRHKLGLHIENRTDTVDGKKRSWFRLAPGPSVPTPAPSPQPQPAPAQPALFDMRERHNDLG